MLSPRDRRALQLGGVAAALIVAVALSLPLARRTLERERAIAAEADLLSRLLGAVSHRDSIAHHLQLRAASREMLRLPIDASSSAQAAALASDALRAMADSSQLTVVQVDAPESADIVSVQVVGTGDVYAVAEFLDRTRASRWAMSVRTLDVERLAGQTSSDGHERLQLSVTLTALWRPAP